MKNLLRTEIKNKLKQQSIDSINTASQRICENLNKIVDQHSFTNILAWIPFFVGEINLESFINLAINDYPVYLPKLEENAGNSEMYFSKIGRNWKSELDQKFKQVPEPTTNERLILRENDLNLIILPGLAFDRNGNRLGRGKGHYDKFLEGVKNYNFIKVGVCLNWQVLECVPFEAHDIAVDAICTDRDVLLAT